MPKISVIMSVYNTKEEYLREAIESILNQTYTDFEFIILNDGSTNNAENIVLSYNDNRIKYHKNEKNLGLPKTRNKLLDLSDGEYIAVMDSDDISLPERFEKQINFLENNKEISLLGSWFEMFPETKIIKNPKKVKYLDLMSYCCLGQPTAMWRRADFEKYGLKYDENFKTAEDYELWSRAIKFLNIANLEEVLIKYRWHGENVSISKKIITENKTREIQEKMLSALSDNEMHREKISELIFDVPLKYTPIQKIFSIKNNLKHTIITIFGIKIKLPRKNRYIFKHFSYK